jgi:hypothetical protein
MLEFPVRLIQELPVVFSCAEYGCFQGRSSDLLTAEPVGIAKAHCPIIVSQAAPKPQPTAKPTIAAVGHDRD